MPRGGRPKKTHKGQRRHFTNEEDSKKEEEKKRKEREWRKQKGFDSEDSEGEGSGKESGDEKPQGAAAGGEKEKPRFDSVAESESESESESDEEEKEKKAKGVEGVIEIENPNRVVQKTKKITALDVNTAGTTQLSRREREEVAKQQAAAHYRKLHEAGKTEEAQSDLARLAIIRKQREDQAKKKNAEIKAKEATAKEAEKKLLARKKGI